MLNLECIAADCFDWSVDEISEFLLRLHKSARVSRIKILGTCACRPTDVQGCELERCTSGMCKDMVLHMGYIMLSIRFV